jgi:hypothetical protein
MLLVSQSHVPHVFLSNLLKVIHFKSFRYHKTFKFLKVFYYMFRLIWSSSCVYNYSWGNCCASVIMALVINVWSPLCACVLEVMGCSSCCVMLCLFIHISGKIFLFYTGSRPALSHTQPPIQGVTGILSTGVMRPVRETDHTPPSTSEVKNCGATPLVLYMFSAYEV